VVRDGDLATLECGFTIFDVHDDVCRVSVDVRVQPDHAAPVSATATGERERVITLPVDAGAVAILAIGNG